jgi:hypothetical protein
MSVAMLSVAQVRYRTSELQRLASVLSLNGPAIANDGIHYQTVDGKPVVVRVTNGTVSHIGIRLFGEQIRALDKSPILDFLERYFLQLWYPPKSMSASAMVRDDQFRFLQGSLATVSTLQPTDGFSYTFDQNNYVAVWTRHGSDILKVSFPVEYELISGENKIEAENNIMDDIRKIATVRESVYEQKSTPNFYMIPELSSRLYFDKGRLVVSGLKQEQSAANLMLTTAVEGDYRLQMTQVSYGFKKTVAEVPLGQWITFCKCSGCQLYFGIDRIEPDGTVCGIVLAVNQAENYNHVMTVRIPMSLYDQRRGTVEAWLYPYIPTHNVRDMFAKFKSTNRKEISNR